MKLDEQELATYLFSNVEAAPMRHETLMQYTVPSDGSDYARYLRGESEPDPSVGAAWRSFLQEKKAQGRPVSRVRVLYEHPSEYLLFEMEWLYTRNVDAGERITILDLTEVQRPPELVDDEFWLLTEEDAIVMHYAPDGTFLDGETAEGARARGLAASAYAAHAQGQPFTRWWSEHPEYHRASWLRKRASA